VEFVALRIVCVR